MELKKGGKERESERCSAEPQFLKGILAKGLLPAERVWCTM